MASAWRFPQNFGLRVSGLWTLDLRLKTLDFLEMPIFMHTHRVTYSDCTAGNHVYYSRFLDIVEAARGEFFRHRGRTFLYWQEQSTIFPVVECRLRYLAPARYDEL